MLEDVRVTVCDTFRSRARGLLGVTELPDDECVLLVPCRSVHTFGMRMAIDVAFLDREGTVLDIRPNVKRGRLVVSRYPLRTRSAVEAGAGAFSRWGLRVGQRW